MSTISYFFKTNKFVCVKHKNFIESAMKIHKNIYDYSKVIYTNMKIPVIIGCKLHGDFNQVPSKHLSGQGCCKCGSIRRGNMRRKTVADFENQANTIHFQKYDYSKSNYTTCCQLITIICKEHGEFKQTPSNHLRGHGCSACAGNKHKTTTQFIEEANKIHNNRYLYERTEYKQANTKVVITCKIHGDFEQTPHHHLNRGDGCQECAFNVPYTTETFIAASAKLHNNYYNYAKCHYSSIFKNVIIVCPTHGEFEQQAHSHLSGYGCKECGHIRSGLSRRTSQEDWIAMANSKHNNVYNYDKVIYIKGTLPVTITCPIHGDFNKMADLHLAGSGCLKCRPQYSKGQIQYLEYLRISMPWIQHALNGGEKKIGDSNYKADGYCVKNNEIIEFHGCLWHGCPKCYNHGETNPVTKRTFAEEYIKTCNKKEYIKQCGYKYYEIWECQWKKAIHAINILKFKWKQYKL